VKVFYFHCNFQSH